MIPFGVSFLFSSVSNQMDNITGISDEMLIKYIIIA
jgi:hypothetical protein